MLPYGTNAKRTLLAKAIFTKDGVKRVSFLPMMIDTQYRPEVLHNGDPRFDDIVRFHGMDVKGYNHNLHGGGG